MIFSDLLEKVLVYVLFYELYIIDIRYDYTLVWV